MTSEMGGAVLLSPLFMLVLRLEPAVAIDRRRGMSQSQLIF